METTAQHRTAAAEAESALDFTKAAFHYDRCVQLYPAPRNGALAQKDIADLTRSAVSCRNAARAMKVGT